MIVNHPLPEPVQTIVNPTPTVTIRASSFDPAQTAKSVLCLEVGRDQFRFMVCDNRRRGYYLEDYTFPSLLTDRSPMGFLGDIFREHPVLTGRSWQEVRIGVNTSSFTLVPKPLFRKEYAGSYLSFMRGAALPAHEFAQVYEHDAENMLSVFNLEHPLADYFSEVYPLQPLTFIHQTGALLQATADLSSRVLGTQPVYLYFEDEFITIIHRRDKVLRYCNRFGYKNVQDLVYYVLYILDELALDPAQTSVVLHGEITPFAEAYTVLSRFLTRLSFGEHPPGLTLTGEFDDLPDHRYLSLYGLTLLND